MVAGEAAVVSVEAVVVSVEAVVVSGGAVVVSVVMMASSGQVDSLLLA